MYFLDDMSQEAFGLAYEGWDDSQKESWEQARLIAYYTAAPYLKGRTAIKSFLPLKWDKENKDKAPKSSKERFLALDKKLSKFVNNGR